jgi:hypothetical protein
LKSGGGGISLELEDSLRLPPSGGMSAIGLNSCIWIGRYRPAVGSGVGGGGISLEAWLGLPLAGGNGGGRLNSSNTSGPLGHDIRGGGMGSAADEASGLAGVDDAAALLLAALFLPGRPGVPAGPGFAVLPLFLGALTSAFTALGMALALGLTILMPLEGCGRSQSLKMYTDPGIGHTFFFFPLAIAGSTGLVIGKSDEV